MVATRLCEPLCTCSVVSLILRNVHRGQRRHVDAVAGLEYVGQRQPHHDGDRGDHFEVNNGFQSDAAQLFRIPTPAIPTISVEITIGTTIILIRRIKISPAGLRILLTSHSRDSVWLCNTAPTIIPSTNAIRICQARLILHFSYPKVLKDSLRRTKSQHGEKNT